MRFVKKFCTFPVVFSQVVDELRAGAGSSSTRFAGLIEVGGPFSWGFARIRLRRIDELHPRLLTAAPPALGDMHSALPKPIICTTTLQNSCFLHRKSRRDTVSACETVSYECELCAQESRQLVSIRVHSWLEVLWLRLCCAKVSV